MMKKYQSKKDLWDEKCQQKSNERSDLEKKKDK